jgi:hypothetical protein
MISISKEPIEIIDFGLTQIYSYVRILAEHGDETFNLRAR